MPSEIVYSVIIAVLLAIFKIIKNEKIRAFFYGVCYAGGVTVTLGLSKWPWTAPLWNKYVEPWFIDMIDNVVGGAIEGFVNGLRSDNK